MSNGRAATKECSECNFIFPVTQMTKQMENVFTGKSGIGVSTNFSRKGSTRFSSGKSYTSRKQVWYCNDCFHSDKPLKYKGEPLWDFENSPANRMLMALGIRSRAVKFVICITLPVASVTGWWYAVVPG